MITPNKTLIAKHGDYLSKLAEINNVNLEFEAAVAGGIPIIKTIKEGLATNKINKVYGILNGTTNYILTEMEKTGENFEKVLPQDLIQYGFIPELIGRLPVISSLNTLDEKSLLQVLTEPKNSLLKQYKKLF